MPYLPNDKPIYPRPETAPPSQNPNRASKNSFMTNNDIHPDQTVSELRQQKTELEKQIKKLVENFNRENGIPVKQIKIEPIMFRRHHGGNVYSDEQINIKIKIKLENI
jgi:hypothetical protein